MPQFRPRHKVYYQELDGFEDDYAGPEPEWDTRCRFRAEIMPLMGVELERARQINSLVTHRLRVRYSKAVHPYGRFKVCGEGGRTFYIKSAINEEERNRFLTCLCMEDVTKTAAMKKAESKGTL